VNFQKSFLFIVATMTLVLSSALMAMGESATLADDIPDLQIGDTGHGVVVTSDRQAIYVQKYDLEAQENITVTFNLTENFKIKNVSALSELSQGDRVEFSYYTKNDKFYLSRLVVYKQKPAKPVKEFDF
jgi:Cu/Ag efflux protein CusF